eukprot:3878954-Amphidinium_carterae.2
MHAWQLYCCKNLSVAVPWKRSRRVRSAHRKVSLMGQSMKPYNRAAVAKNNLLNCERCGVREVFAFASCQPLYKPCCCSGTALCHFALVRCTCLRLHEDMDLSQWPRMVQSC